jgi:hypothetical protein
VVVHTDGTRCLRLGVCIMLNSCCFDALVGLACRLLRQASGGVVANAMAASANGLHAGRQHARSSHDGSALRQRELTWALFEDMWRKGYEAERKANMGRIDPKLIYQVCVCAICVCEQSARSARCM